MQNKRMTAKLDCPVLLNGDGFPGRIGATGVASPLYFFPPEVSVEKALQRDGFVEIGGRGQPDGDLQAQERLHDARGVTTFLAAKRVLDRHLKIVHHRIGS